MLNILSRLKAKKVSFSENKLYLTVRLHGERVAGYGSASESSLMFDRYNFHKNRNKKPNFSSRNWGYWFSYKYPRMLNSSTCFFFNETMCFFFILLLEPLMMWFDKNKILPNLTQSNSLGIFTKYPLKERIIDNVKQNTYKIIQTMMSWTNRIN